MGVRADGESRVLDVATGSKGSAVQIATDVSAALRAAGHAGEPVLLAVPSSWCFSASVETADLPKNDRKAMLYRLEEKLPLAAEGMVADFVARAGGKAVGVCARLEVLRPIVEALEAAQVPVQSVTPAALLVGQHLLSANNASVELLLCQDGGGPEGIDAIATESETLVNWAVTPPDVSDLQLHLGFLSMTLPAVPKLSGCGLERGFVESVERALSVRVPVAEAPAWEVAVLAGAEVLHGGRRPWVEFRRGPLAIRDALRLHRKPLNAALAAAVLLAMSVAAILLVRAQRYAAVEASANQEMADAFREQFPGWEVPGNVRLIVESEHRKAAAASRGAGTDDRRARSALKTFLDLLGRLPAEGRIAISRMSFEEGAFELEGQVRSYEQLDGIAAAARKSGMEVAAPESHKNAAGFWDFTLRGTAPQSPVNGEMAKGGG